MSNRFRTKGLCWIVQFNAAVIYSIQQPALFSIMVRLFFAIPIDPRRQATAHNCVKYCP